jgi:hypothetical protein
VTGRVNPGTPGTRLVVQRRLGKVWVRAGTVRVGTRGAYRWTAPAAGRYRVLLGTLAGPAVRVR